MKFKKCAPSQFDYNNYFPFDWVLIKWASGYFRSNARIFDLLLFASSYFSYFNLNDFGSKINTAIMKKQLGCIQVQVPPDIVDDRSTSDVTVNEGDNVTLTCTATGKPAPRIVWRREDGQKIVVYRPMATASAPGSNHNNLHGTKTSSSSGTVSNATTSTTADVAAITASGTHHPHQHHQGTASTTTRERSKGKLFIPLSVCPIVCTAINFSSWMFDDTDRRIHWPKGRQTTLLAVWAFASITLNSDNRHLGIFCSISIFSVCLSVVGSVHLSLFKFWSAFHQFRRYHKWNLKSQTTNEFRKSTDRREFNLADQMDIPEIQETPRSLME